jgi:uncharacterized protein (DUF1697 family)
MVKYAAFLRGIAPLNPNMQNARLREVFEREGLKNVQTVISSGNVLFETAEKDIGRLEAMIEKALPEQLGFNSTTFILGQAQLKKVADHNPYGEEKASKQVYQLVGFTKEEVKLKEDIPHSADGQGYGILGNYGRAVFCRLNPASTKTPQAMRWLEKEFNKEITTRTWLTVQRVLKKLDEM